MSDEKTTKLEHRATGWFLRVRMPDRSRPRIRLGPPTMSADAAKARAAEWHLRREELTAIYVAERVRHGASEANADPSESIVGMVKRIASKRRIGLTESPVLVTRTGVVYFAQAGAGGPVKIGIATELPHRLHAIQVANASKIVLLGAVTATAQVEHWLHQAFCDDRIRGEWFRPHHELIAVARAMGEANSNLMRLWRKR